MEYIFGIAILVAAIMAVWEMFEPEFTNILFLNDLYIAVDYTVPVNLLVYSYTLHFNAISVGK